MAAEGEAATEPSWLTDVLRACGALTNGSVVQVTHSPAERHTATVSTLEVTYTRDASTSAPARIFLKHGTRKDEAGFYQAIAPSLPAGIVPACYWSDWDDTASRSTLLLEDVSALFGPAGQEPPSDTQVGAALGALATLHATWWRRTDLDGIAAAGSASRKQFVLDTAFERFDEFMIVHGGSLNGLTRKAMAKFFGSNYRERFAARLANGPLTAIHGDAHVGQVLFGRDGAPEVRLTDFEDWQAGVPTDDVAFLLVMHGYKDWAPGLDASFLASYLGSLAGQGVSGYPAAACNADYRLSQEGLMAWPVFWAMHFGGSETMWRRVLASIMAATW